MFLNLKGRVVIEVRDAENGQLKDAIAQDNLIPNETIKNLFGTLAAEPFLNKRISISAQTVTPSLQVFGVGQIMATGYIASGVTSPELNIATPPYYGKIQNRIDPVGVARTFNTVALTALASANTQNTSATASAYLLLSTPCTQGANDFLDISYYIFVENGLGSGINLNSTALKDLTRAIFGIDRVNFGGGSFVSQFHNSLLDAFWGNAPDLNNYPYHNLGRSLSLAGSYNSVPALGSGWNSLVSVLNHFKFRAVLNYGINDNIGGVVNCLLQGFNRNFTSAFTVKSLLENQSSPMQNGVFKLTGSVKPFFDSLEIATSSGKIAIAPSPGGWTGKYPHIYQIRITTGGAVGVGAYNLRRRQHLGFSGNTFSDLTVPNPYRNPVAQPHPSIHGWQEGDEIEAWDEVTVCQYDSSGVTLLNLFDGSFKSWDSTSTPVMGATAIGQCAVDPVNQLIYVGCRNTGIWVINVAANTVSNPVTFPCYGIDVGRNNVAFAVIDGALISSTNWGAVLSFTYTGITDSNWNKVRWVKADASSANDNLAIAMNISGATHRIVWWSRAQAAGITGWEDNNLVRNYPGCVECSAAGFWVGMRAGISLGTDGLWRLTFGSASITRLGSLLAVSKTANNSYYGNQSYYKIAFVDGDVLGVTGLINASGTVTKTFSALSSATFALPLRQVVLFSDKMRQLFAASNDAWENFGWDSGAGAWVKGGTGAKTIHASTDNLIDGLQIRFEDGSTPPHFAQGEFFNQFVNWGLLKDTATTLTYETGWYSKPVYFKQPVPAGLTVPASAPYTLVLPIASDSKFITIEVDTPRHNQFTLNGTPITTLYTLGTIPPGPNEIQVFGTTAMLEFNAADAGKTLGGYYAYIANP